VNRISPGITENNAQRVDPLPTYVLVTPARNEAAFIEKTIESVIRQTVLPAKWVIVNDGSTDDTGAIVAKYTPQYSWIELVNLPARRERNFAAKVHAFNVGLERVKDIPYEIIGNLDADISFDDDHLEFLLTRFREDPKLGVAGTTFKEANGYNSETDSFEGSTMCLVNARSSGASASVQSADTSQTRQEASIGSLLRQPV
jgi:glycosyltransferase involved in cell wall biosynthesis